MITGFPPIAWGFQRAVSSLEVEILDVGTEGLGDEQTVKAQ